MLFLTPYLLAGLTCTGDNCAEKGFFQAAAAKEGIAVIYPDTSPRRVPAENRCNQLMGLGGIGAKGEDDAYVCERFGMSSF